MKIAYIGQKGIPVITGGVERHVEELSFRMAKLGHEVFVYTRPHYTPKELNYYKGVNLISLPSIYTKHLDAISHTFLATIHALFKKYDLIHYHGVGPALLSIIPRIFKPKAKIIVTFHSLDHLHEKWGWLAKKILQLGEFAACYFPHQTIVVSKNLQAYCWKTFHKKTTYLPNGVEATIQAYNDKTILELFNLEPKKYFLVVNRLIPHKNIEETIRAFMEFSLKGYKLVITGDGFFTDNYVKQLKDLAKNDKNIVFTGNQQNINLQSLYQNALAYISSSKNEGLSFTLLEALSYKLPAILKNIEDIREFIEAGVVLDYDQPENLKSTMFRVASDSELAEEYGLIGYNFVKENFNWEKIISVTNELYFVTINRPLLKCKNKKFLNYIEA
jgi:glycosyltransferase involved in cell wall biosynthesis